MAGAPPNRGAPLPLLLFLLPGCLCWTSPSLPPPPPPSRLPPQPLTVETGGRTGAGGSGGCPPGAIWVSAGPTSRTADVGTPLSLECEYRAPPGARVTWYRVCPRGNCSVGALPVAGGVPDGGDGATLAFPRLAHADAGLYYCRVEAGADVAQSCGTFLRVRDPPAVPFLNIKESTKNRIITAEGVLLLLCAVGPGLLLLFRKRWANERLLEAKKSSAEEDNLYEGLNLDECSMYEDISRGLQPTYQDVGSIRGSDPQLEKP